MNCMFDECVYKGKKLEGTPEEIINSLKSATSNIGIKRKFNPLPEDPIEREFISIYKNTGRTLKEAFGILRKKGYDSKTIIEVTLNALGDLIWEE